MRGSRRAYGAGRSSARSPRCSPRRPGSRSRVCSCCWTTGRCAASGQARARLRSPVGKRSRSSRPPLAMLLVTASSRPAIASRLDQIALADRLVARARRERVVCSARRCGRRELSSHYPHPYLPTRRRRAVDGRGARALGARARSCHGARRPNRAPRLSADGMALVPRHARPGAGVRAVRHPGDGRSLHASPAHRPVRRGGVRRLAAARPPAAESALRAAAVASVALRSCSRSGRPRSSRRACGAMRRLAVRPLLFAVMPHNAVMRQGIARCYLGVGREGDARRLLEGSRER